MLNGMTLRIDRYINITSNSRALPVTIISAICMKNTQFASRKYTCAPCKQKYHSPLNFFALVCVLYAMKQTVNNYLCHSAAHTCDTVFLHLCRLYFVPFLNKYSSSTNSLNNVLFPSTAKIVNLLHFRQNIVMTFRVARVITNNCFIAKINNL